MTPTDAIQDEVVAHTLDLLSLDESLRRKAVIQLNRLRNEILGTLAENPNASLQSLLNELDTAFVDYYAKIQTTMNAELAGLAQLEGEITTGSINNALGISTARGVTTNTYMNRVLDETLIQGAPMTEWWTRQTGVFTNNFKDQMRQGQLLGESVQQLSKRVKDLTGIATRQADAITRTSVLSVANKVRLDTYAANSDIIKGVYASVTLDGRTSEICRARSGNSWSIPEYAPINGTAEPFPGIPPWHWNCRSSLTAIIKSFAEITGDKTISQISKGTRASMDGQVPEDLTYEAWLKRKSVAFQKEVLGEGRYDLWKKDGLSFSQMVDKTGQPLTIDEIRSKAGLDK